MLHSIRDDMSNTSVLMHIPANPLLRRSVILQITYMIRQRMKCRCFISLVDVTREQRYGLSLMLQEGKSRKDIDIAKELQISFYFCKPYHSWERGANENTNGLITQYIPKGTDFSEITDEFVSWVETKLNNRPRKRLGYLTPNENFNSILTN